MTIGIKGFSFPRRRVNSSSGCPTCTKRAKAASFASSDSLVSRIRLIQDVRLFVSIRGFSRDIARRRRPKRERGRSEQDGKDRGRSQHRKALASGSVPRSGKEGQSVK
jgi:hypothetical protein